jgi:hypothetical protein
MGKHVPRGFCVQTVGSQLTGASRTQTAEGSELPKTYLGGHRSMIAADNRRPRLGPYRLQPIDYVTMTPTAWSP